MECTGERYLPDVDGDWTLEHTHRYLLACELAAGKIVLDIASGEGYGSRMLAGVAAQVTGVDISLEAVTHAAAKYPHPVLTFVQGSVTAIPLADASVDLVTSFETIEHLTDHEAMLGEIRRVLRPGGLLLISSPDKYEYSDLPGYANEYHVKELYRHEFETLLKNTFSHTRMLGQRVVFGSLIGAEDEAPFVSWRKNEPASRTVGLANTEYWIALAGDGPLPLLPSGVIKAPIESSNSLRKVAEERENIRAEAVRHQMEADVYKAEFERYQRWEKEARGYIAQLEAQKEAVETELDKIYHSRSWRLTRPLRYLMDLARKMKGGNTPVALPAPAAEPVVELPPAVWPPDVRALERQLTLRDDATADTTALSQSLGVFLHIYYPYVAGEMLACLRHLPESARIHISTDSDTKRDDLQRLFDKEGFGQRTELRVCPNRGWDIAPFLLGFEDRIPNYSLIVRLHSKRSGFLPEETGAAWRAMLYSSLAGSAGRVNAIMQAFADDPQLGMVCPPQAPHYEGSVDCGANLSQMQKILRAHDILLQPGTPIDFPMGSMFWCRPEVLYPWLNGRFSYDDFAPTSGGGARDGSLAHALERLFFFGCGITGHSWARIQAFPDP